MNVTVLLRTVSMIFYILLFICPSICQTIYLFKHPFINADILLSSIASILWDQLINTVIISCHSGIVSVGTYQGRSYTKLLGGVKCIRCAKYTKIFSCYFMRTCLINRNYNHSILHFFVLNFIWNRQLFSNHFNH